MNYLGGIATPTLTLKQRPKTKAEMTYQNIYLYISERNSVVVGLNPTRPTFYSYFKESFSGEYHMYQFIPLHSCGYLKKTSIKMNVATDEGIS